MVSSKSKIKRKLQSTRYTSSDHHDHDRGKMKISRYHKESEQNEKQHENEKVVNWSACEIAACRRR